MPSTETITQKKLTPKEQRFVDEYLIDFNGTQALIRAGYKSKTENAAAVRAIELLRKPKIAQVVQERRAEHTEKSEIDTIAILREAARIALSDVGKLYDEKGNLKPIGDLDDDIRRCIAAIETEEIWEGRGNERTLIGYRKKVKLWDKNSALERLFKHLVLFPQQPGSKENPLHLHHTFDLTQLPTDELGRIRNNPESVILSTTS